MADVTGISCTHHRLNFWEEGRRRTGEDARDSMQVRRTRNWSAPYRWQRRAQQTGVPELVSTCSLSDFFIEQADSWRADAWEVIKDCPELIFQILTKRPERAKDHLPGDWGEGYANVWLGVSIENNDHVSRADVLRQVPARVRFISAEPLLGPLPDLNLDGFHWLIVGGESGRDFRPMESDWARELREKARAAEVAFFFKQGADRFPGRGDRLDGREWKEFPLPGLDR